MYLRVKVYFMLDLEHITMLLISVEKLGQRTGLISKPHKILNYICKLPPTEYFKMEPNFYIVNMSGSKALSISILHDINLFHHNYTQNYIQLTVVVYLS